LVLHPRWCVEWFQSYIAELSDADRQEVGEGTPLVTAAAFGCCGPTGAVRCAAGHAVGHIQGDCDQDQWLKLEVHATERSDLVDGYWEIYDLKHKERLKMCGQMATGQREGEWLVYEESLKQVPIAAKGPGSRGRWITQTGPIADFELVRIEQYQRGILVQSA
jgi:hypothetical protein